MGEVIVQFRPGVDEARRGAIRALHLAAVVRRFEILRMERLALPAAANPIAVAQALRNHPDVEAAQPNFIRQAVSFASPNDPYYGHLWGLTKVSAPSAWSAFGPGTETVVVADIDTGVDYTHPDLAANMWTNPGEIAGNGVDDDSNGYVDDVYGIDAANNDSDPADDHWHGTHTAGTFGAVSDNAYGVTGLTSNVKVLACKFLTANGGTDADAIECFNYVVGLKQRGVNIRVTSNSWGAARGGYFPAALKNAIDAAGSAGILNVFAAGNDGVDIDYTPFDPASFTSPSIVSVAASDGNDVRAGWSNYGAVSVDLAAPGVDILSTYPGGFAWASGTSMATPHVAGVAALLLAHRPSLTVAEAKQVLLDSVDRGDQWSGLVASSGRLNAYQSVSVLYGTPVNGSPAVTVTSPLAGQSFAVPASIELAAAATDGDGVVTRVEFYVDGGYVGSDGEAPFAVTWSQSNAGTYAVTAVAYDDDGAAAASEPVTLYLTAPESTPVEAPTEVTIVSPADGSSFRVRSLIDIAASASDADGVARVEFYAGDEFIGADASGDDGYAVQWMPMTTGWYSLTAIAYDRFEQATGSSAVRVHIRRR